MSEKSSADNKKEKKNETDILNAVSAENSADLQISCMNIIENEKKKRIENSQTEILSVSDSSSFFISIYELLTLFSLSISYCCFLSICHNIVAY